MNQSSFIFLLFVGCKAVTINQVISGSGTVNGDRAGTFTGFPTSFTSNSGDYYQKADNNIAISSTAGGARAGNELFFNGSASISNSTFDVTDVSLNNVANATGGNAVSGSLIVFNVIDTSSDVSKLSDISGNTAIARKSGTHSAPTHTPVPAPAPIAISGTQTQVGSLDNSTFTGDNSASNNNATIRDSGDALSGVENAFGSVTDSYVKQNNSAEDNIATTKDGVATSGVENGISIITDSTPALDNIAVENVAKSKKGNAIAGVQNSINTISGSFPGGSSNIDFTSKANANKAEAQDGGTAVAGIATNIVSTYKTDIDITGTAYNNEAFTKGTSTLSYDAISGTSTVISDIEVSTLNVNSVAGNNIAFNMLTSTEDQLGNDAVAGSQLVVGNAKDSSIIVAGNSYDNKAFAVNGDAIAGNQVQIGQTDSDSIVALDLTSSNNQALSMNGAATIGNDVSIGGGAKVFGWP